MTSIVNVVNTFRMLDIGLPESRNALILAGMIEDCFVQREWLSDPLRESGVVSDIILREGAGQEWLAHWRKATG